jgi:hypothetical protein
VKARVLRHEADALAPARDGRRNAEQVDGAGRRLEKTRDKPEQRGFPGAAAAHDGDDLVSDFEIDIAEDQALIACADTVERDRDWHRTRC